MSPIKLLTSSPFPVVLNPGSFSLYVMREINRIKEKENKTITTDSFRIVILLISFLTLFIEIIIP